MTAAADLASQLDELRQTVADLQSAVNAQPRVSLVPVESAAYVGQATGLTVTVLNRADSTPLPNQPVTLVTSWGVLRGEDSLVEGTGILGVTASDGTVRVTLRPHLSLDANEDQDALEAMLALLDPAAPTPNDALAVFQTLAAQYRWEANSGYRNAVDAYFRDFGQKVLNSTASRDYMSSWHLIPATVIAHVGETNATTAAAATMTVLFRDWLGPWYQVYQGYATSQIQLGNDFTFVKQQSTTPSGLMAGVFGRIGNAVDAEFGVVGKKVAQNVAQKAIGDFLNTGVSDLSNDMKSAVGPILDTGSRALASAGGSVVSALGQTHATAVTAAGSVAGKVDKTDFNAALTLKANAADLSAVQSAISTKADITAVSALQASIAGKLDASALTDFQNRLNATLQGKANVSDLQTLQTVVTGKADLTALTTFQQQTTSALAAKAATSDLQALQTTVGAKANASDLKALQTAVAAKADLAAFNTFQTSVNTAIAGKADASDLRTLQAAIAKKVDVTDFQAFQTQINNIIAVKANFTDLQAVEATMATKADAVALTAFEAQTGSALAAKADASALTVLQTSTASALKLKMDATAVTSIVNRITALEGKVR